MPPDRRGLNQARETRDASPSVSSNRHSGRSQVLGNRWTKFSNGDTSGDGAIVLQCDLRNIGGKPLEQTPPAVVHEVIDRLHESAIVDGLGQVIGSCRAGKIDIDVDIDGKRLTSRLFLGENPTKREHAKLAKLDCVDHCQPILFRGSVAARVTISRPKGPIGRDRSCSTVTMALVSSGSMPVQTRYPAMNPAR